MAGTWIGAGIGCATGFGGTFATLKALDLECTKEIGPVLLSSFGGAVGGFTGGLVGIAVSPESTDLHDETDLNALK